MRLAPTAFDASLAGAMLGSVPIVIAETGHRDLPAGEAPGLRRRVRGFFEGLGRAFPDASPVLLSSLAEGAGRLVAREALALGVPLVAILPMPAALYRDDFRDEDSRLEFDELCARAKIYELPLIAGEDAAVTGHARDRQYAQLGVFLSSHCQILLALWDGKPSAALGGTAQVVQYHLTGAMPGYAGDPPGVQQILADDENDLVYHIVCSRERAFGAPLAGLSPLDVAWLTSKREARRTAELPPAYAAVFERCEQFNRDLLRHREKLLNEEFSLLGPSSEGVSPIALRIELLFRAADWLAMRYQRRVHVTLLTTHVVAVLMGLAFIFYSDLAPTRYLIVAFLGLFGVGLLLYVVAKRRGWHRKYLDYRALAEGLRVQFYWEVAGIHRAAEATFAHDNFLQKQDVELGWIRNVMRWAQLRGEPPPATPGPEAVRCVADAWVNGQLEYYARKAVERSDKHRQTERLALLALWLGMGVAALLAILHDLVSNRAEDVLLVLMGVLPLLAAAREAYAHKRADKELIKQYRFMHRVFANAKHRLDAADGTVERQQILRALGEACLDEHAEWILVHRERPLEHSRL